MKAQQIEGAVMAWLSPIECAAQRCFQRMPGVCTYENTSHRRCHQKKCSFLSEMSCAQTLTRFVWTKHCKKKGQEMIKTYGRRGVCRSACMDFPGKRLQLHNLKANPNWHTFREVHDATPQHETFKTPGQASPNPSNFGRHLEVPLLMHRLEAWKAACVNSWNTVMEQPVARNLFQSLAAGIMLVEPQQSSDNSLVASKTSQLGITCHPNLISKMKSFFGFAQWIIGAAFQNWNSKWLPSKETHTVQTRQEIQKRQVTNRWSRRTGGEVCADPPAWIFPVQAPTTYPASKSKSLTHLSPNFVKSMMPAWHFQDTRTSFQTRATLETLGSPLQ